MSDEAIVKLILGVRGCGKTVKLFSLLRPVRRRLTVNTLNRGGFTEGVVFHTVPELKSYWNTVWQTDDFHLIFTPEHGDIERVCIEIGDLCRFAMVCGNMTLAIEEMNVLFGVQRKPAELNSLIFAGREPGIELIGVAQRPRGFGPEIGSQSKEAFIFHSHETEALKYFRDWMGKDASEAIRSLEGHQYLHWSFENGPTDYTIQEDELLPDMRESVPS